MKNLNSIVVKIQSEIVKFDFYLTMKPDENWKSWDQEICQHYVVIGTCY